MAPQCDEAVPCHGRDGTVSAGFLLDDLAWPRQILSPMAYPSTPRERELQVYYTQLAEQTRQQLASLRKGCPQTCKEFLR